MVDRARSSLRRNKHSKTLDEAQVDLNNLLDENSDEPNEDWLALYGASVLEAALAEVRQQVEPKNPKKWASFELHTLLGKKAPEAAAELGISPNLVYQNALRVYRDVVKLCLLKYEESLEHD
jgi:DNA-directed RNA polymerase specialized sigma24 family protein